MMGQPESDSSRIARNMAGPRGCGPIELPASCSGGMGKSFAAAGFGGSGPLFASWHADRCGSDSAKGWHRKTVVGPMLAADPGSEGAA